MTKPCNLEGCLGILGFCDNCAHKHEVSNVYDQAVRACLDGRFSDGVRILMEEGGLCEECAVYEASK